MPTNINSPAPGSKSPDGLFSVKRAAAYLGISEGWLYKSGIPFAKLGRRRLYRPSDLDRFVEQNVSHGKQKGEA